MPKKSAAAARPSPTILPKVPAGFDPDRLGRLHRKPASLVTAAIEYAQSHGTLAAAKQFDVSAVSIIRWCRKQGIRIQKKAKRKFCRVCRKSFKYSPDGSKERYHCSRKCSVKAHRIKFPCPTCRKIINVTISEKNRRKFCSHACYAKSNIVKHQAPKRRGANWKPARLRCINLYRGKCVVCDSPGSDVHHVIPYRYFNGDYESANHIGNLALLCQRCHLIAERRCRREFSILKKLPGGFKIGMMAL